MIDTEERICTVLEERQIYCSCPAMDAIGTRLARLISERDGWKVSTASFCRGTVDESLKTLFAAEALRAIEEHQRKINGITERLAMLPRHVCSMVCVSDGPASAGTCRSLNPLEAQVVSWVAYGGEPPRELDLNQ